MAKMKSFKQYLSENVIPKIRAASAKFKKGWWLDKDVITFYHGTHKDNLPFIQKNGIVAPKTGSTAGWVSLALDPLTAHGYASMSGSGGETKFRTVGGKPVNVPHGDRITFVIRIPKSEVLSKMAPERGAMQSTANRLKDKDEYEKLVKSGKMDDERYYQLTEIRWPNVVPKEYIIGYMKVRE